MDILEELRKLREASIQRPGGVLAEKKPSGGMLTPQTRRGLEDYVRNYTQADYAPGSAPIMRSGDPETSMDGIPYQGTPEMTRTQEAAYMTMPMPVVGDVTGLLADYQMYRDEPESRSWGNYLMSGLGAVGLGASIPPVSAMRRAAGDAGGLLMSKKAREQGKMATKWAEENPPLAPPGRVQDYADFEGTTEIAGKTYGFDQDAIAREYPPVTDPILNYDPKGNKGAGKFYWGKQLNPIEADLQKARKAAQADIREGNYTPYFDPSKRTDVDYSNYDTGIDTQDLAQPKTQKTIDSYRQDYDTPEARAKLQEAYDRGAGLENADRWYFMEQLEKEFIDEFGPEQGRALFKERFAESMATTTGGADPTANYLSASYVNNIKASGSDFPTNSYQMPHPIGGRYISGNIDFAKKGTIDPADHPKRHNFAHNFLGNPNNATIDEQMSGAWGKNAPPGMSYGVFEEVIQDMARQNNVDARGFQDVGWAGLKNVKEPGYQGMPMIDHVNEAIERTSRITGKTPQQVVKDSILHARAPLYGVTGGLLGAGILDRINGGQESRSPDS